jgi:hypothetical protein
MKTGIDVSIGSEINLDARYQISYSRNDPVDIYAYVHANKRDPAFSVSVPLVISRDAYLTQMRHENTNRALCQN